MKKIQSRFALALSLLLCMSIFTGCTSSQDDSAADTSGGAVQNDAADENVGSGEYDPTATGTFEDGSTPTFSGTKLRLTINGEDEVVIAMYDNTAVDALLERLPLNDLSFSDLSGIEKPIDRLDEPISLGQEEPGYDPVTGEMVIYRPWANFTIFYGDFRYSPELVPLGKVESGLELIAGQTDDFTGVLELIEEG